MVKASVERCILALTSMLVLKVYTSVNMYDSAKAVASIEGVGKLALTFMLALNGKG